MGECAIKWLLKKKCWLFVFRTQRSLCCKGNTEINGWWCHLLQRCVNHMCDWQNLISIKNGMKWYFLISCLSRKVFTGQWICILTNLEYLVRGILIMVLMRKMTIYQEQRSAGVLGITLQRLMKSLQLQTHNLKEMQSWVCMLSLKNVSLSWAVISFNHLVKLLFSIL